MKAKNYWVLSVLQASLNTWQTYSTNPGDNDIYHSNSFHIKRKQQQTEVKSSG